MNLYGEDHRHIRGALTEFLKPDMLRLYVGKMDSEVRRHLEENWAGRTTVTVLPLMKRMMLDIICALLFGLETGAVRDALAGRLGHPIRASLLLQEVSSFLSGRANKGRIFARIDRRAVLAVRFLLPLSRWDNSSAKRAPGATKIYTRTMFEKFQEVMFESGSYDVDEVSPNEMCVAKHVESDEREQWSKLKYFELMVDAISSTNFNVMWSAVAVEDCWFADEQRVRDFVTLPE
ncbi:hypothetical protein ACQ4PT_023176 [Festuca glaucescens]